MNAKEDYAKEIQSNAPPQVKSLMPSMDRGVLGTEAKDALMEMMATLWRNGFTVTWELLQPHLTDAMKN
ncbi:hypothetical protein PVK06_043560 [Gossypium arboreum]|uniref:Uncharacterized protein n=1 Tax=Gossypium arboreum TaxID=29729 RepID=A0ABR0MP64_GOSAR|nr:hypothetical protein PVK06_043560 [Gossypium arboreum]